MLYRGGAVCAAQGRVAVQGAHSVINVRGRQTPPHSCVVKVVRARAVMATSEHPEK
jgi:hypothetical protein